MQTTCKQVKMQHIKKSIKLWSIKGRKFSKWHENSYRTGDQVNNSANQQHPELEVTMLIPHTPIFNIFATPDAKNYSDNSIYR